MPDANYTDVTIVLDRSGSMSGIWKDHVGGLQKLVQDQKQVPGKCLLSLIVFGEPDAILPVISAQPVAEVAPIEEILRHHGPRGGTALHDAIGKTIVSTGGRLAALPDGDRPGKVLFVIVTDGGENSSWEWRGRIAEPIKHQTEVYSWEFLFLGANQDAVAAGGELGIVPSNSMTFAANGAGSSSAYASISKGVTSYRTTGVKPTFDVADRKAQAEAGAK